MIRSKFLRFLFCGCINCIVGFVISYSASHILPDFEIYLGFFHMSNIVLSHFLGYFLSIPVSYTLNSIVSFKCPLCFKRLLKFYITYIPNYIIQMLVVCVTVDIMHLHKITGLALAVLISMPFTFIFIKLFAFGGKSSANSKAETTKQPSIG